MKKICLGVVLFLWFYTSDALAVCTGTSPNLTAASASFTDVSACVTAAIAGDTINIPAGSATWGSTLSYAKSITLQGAGSSSTVITSSMGAYSPLIEITPPSDTTLTRVTGIGFQLGTLNSGRSAVTINGRPDTAFIPTKVRIDHNALTGGGGSPGGIVTYNQVYGVIDHNTFTNVYSGVFGWGAFDQNQIWFDAYNAGGIFAGTANAMFVEDNSFLYTSAINGATVDASVYIQQGAIYVIRNNTFDASAVVNPNVIELMYNHHGNQEYCFGGTCTTFRGQPIFESYNNTGVCSSTNCEFMSMRGGSNIIHDETFTASGTPFAVVKFDEEECWQSVFFSPLRTTYPAQDQVTNSFVWNVNYNGSNITDVTIAQDNGACSENFIIKDRDYFMHAPQSSGGKTSFTGTRYGGSTTAPTTGDTGSMTFSSSGANAYYPYTPYTYPHPLIAGGSPPVVNGLTCSPTSFQSPATTSSCTATISSGTPTTWIPTVQTCASAQCSSNSTTNPATYSCLYGGACTPCMQANSADGVSNVFCATAGHLKPKYRKPSNLQAN